MPRSRYVKLAQAPGDQLTYLQVDCMQWLIETSPRKHPWTGERMMGEILALWFGSVHQLAMVGGIQGSDVGSSSKAEGSQATTFAIHDLCLHPHWQDELRRELVQSSLPSTTSGLENLVLLDAFVRESTRLSASDAGESAFSSSSSSPSFAANQKRVPSDVGSSNSQWAAESYCALPILRRCAGSRGRLGLSAAASHDA